MMKEIISLMRLDLICMKRKTLLPLAILLIATAAAGIFVHPICMFPILGFSWVPVEAMFDIAAKGNMDKLYGMLPVRRGSLVWARFSLSFIIESVTTLYVVAVSWFAFKLNLFSGAELAAELQNVVTFDFLAILASLFFVLCCVLCACDMTTLFVLGVERQFVGLVICMLIMCGAVFVLVKMDVNIMASVTEFAAAMGDMYLNSVYYLAVFAAGLAVMAAFAAVSFLGTRRREI